MIDKLRKKVFWIIQILLTGIIAIIIVVHLIFNYTKTIREISRTMNDYTMEDFGPMAINKNGEAHPKRKIYTENMYKFEIKNNEITQNDNSANQELEQIALKVCKQKSESGIIDKYMYKFKKTRENVYTVTLVENEELVKYVYKMFIFSGIIFIFLLCIVIIISKKISKMITKPIEQNIEKQKQFISDASHELKTPISIIKINAEMEEKKIGKNKWNSYIQNEAENMDNLINNLLLLSKVENFENIYKYESFNLSKEVEIIVSTFEVLAFDKNVNLSSNITENIQFIGSKEDIKHILSTLIDNAIKHTNSNNNVSVELNKEKSDIILQVKNQGEPIPKDEIDKIFERFYRVDKARNRGEKRYGLGLSIAKSIVEKYAGKIEVICESGITNFKVFIPINNM